MMERRAMLAGAAACFAAEAGAAGVGADDPRVVAAASVFIYALPLYEIARTRGRGLVAGQRINQFSHGRALSDARSRWVTTPNVDTLYSVIWLDLGAGPVEIDLPPPSGRYVSLALMDAFSNNFAVLHPEDPGSARITVAGPQGGTAASGGRTLIAAPTREVWALVRIYVAGEADLDAAHGVQDAFRIAGSSVAAPAEQPLPLAVRGDPAQVFAVMAALVRANPKPPEDRSILEALEALGLAPGATAAPADVLDAGRAAVLVQMRGFARARVGDWFYPKDDLGDFGQDYLYRAQVAIGGLAALPVREALYLSAAAGQGALFQGGAWRLRFPADAPPPAGAFWSLTLYEPDGTGGLYFFDNPERIYAIKNLDPGFRRAADGSATITIAPQRPTDPDVNWLPAPEGRFALIFRAYRPGAALLDRSYRLPPVGPA